MAVDVKSLRIGSHISINGERVEVESLQGGDMVGYITPDNDWFATESWRFEPIPITPGLLKELGFVRKPNADKKRYFDFLWEREDVESDDTCWEHCEKDNFFLLHSGAFGQLNVKYLHEAESFLALHNIELIKE